MSSHALASGLALLALLVLLLLVPLAGNRHAHAHGRHHPPPLALRTLHSNSSVAPSVISWNTVTTPRRISITSMTVEHHSDGSWFLPSFHERHSAGWNRTMLKGKLQRPFACNIRFYAIGLEKPTLQEFVRGGTGYMTIEVKNEVRTEGKKGKMGWYGFDKNESNRLHCYYMTNKDYGSEFIDTPKTLGIAIYCPVLLDLDAGEYAFKSVMQPGYFCRSLADEQAKVEVFLRPTRFSVSVDNYTDFADTTGREEQELIKGEITTNPAAVRLQEAKEIALKDPRPHAVCTVQTFRNHQTGPMLFLFTMYYQRMGWRVIIYDRFGLHKDFIQPLIEAGLGGIDYHPYTLFQLANPNKYNVDYAAKQGTERKFFYNMEKNWGYSGSGKADTADQDQDKSKTYDHCRVEYAHLDMIFFVDADEFFFCPQAGAGGADGSSAAAAASAGLRHSLDQQKQFQQRLMGTFSSQGIEEMRFVRIPYSGVAPAGFNNTRENRSKTDFTNHTQNCMLEAFSRLGWGTNGVSSFTLSQSLAVETAMFKCWSSASAYDNFPKSADLASVCPFHYNHWSCDGMKNGGRDLSKNAQRCRCKVAFDMINGFSYAPKLHRCHLLHFNDNKFRFQSNREKHVNDRGDVNMPCPIHRLFRGEAPPAGVVASSQNATATAAAA